MNKAVKTIAIPAAIAASILGGIGLAHASAAPKPVKPCATVILATRTITGHESDYPLNECGLPIRGEWECGQPQQWGQPAPAPGHPWSCWRVRVRKP